MRNCMQCAVLQRTVRCVFTHLVALVAAAVWAGASSTLKSTSTDDRVENDDNNNA